MTKHKSRPLTMLLVGLLWACFGKAQESVNSTGGDTIGSGGNVAFSIGQVVYTSNTGSSGSIAQGIQNAYEIFTVGIKETTFNVSITTFPNPTADNLTLQVSDFNKDKLSYQVYDMLGKLLSIGEVTAQITQIYTSSFPSATYFIHVVNQENEKLQSFQIIKN